VEKFLKYLKDAVLRRRFTVVSASLGIALFVLLGYAIYDFVSNAKIKDETTQKAVLESELAKFVLAVRLDDGSTLFDNTTDFSKATRTVGVVTLRKSFFGYYLNRANAKNVVAKNIVWTPPRACTTQFPSQTIPSSSAFGLQACFAVLQNDQSGNFVYFTLKYPTKELTRHVRGADVRFADHVVMRIEGDQVLNLRLAYEAPTLAQSRYPSQLQRFDGIHEVSAYLENGQSSRSVSAQAYERGDKEDGFGQNYVTILGRIDSNALIDKIDQQNVWPSPKVKALKISLEVVQKSDGLTKGATLMNLPSGIKGEALISIEQAYVAQVLSKSLLEAHTKQNGKNNILWSSIVLDRLESNKKLSRIQIWSDIWSDGLFHFLGYDKVPQIATNQSLVGVAGVTAVLKSESPRLSDLATRAFLWLSLTSLLILILAGLWIFAVTRLQRIAKTAYQMTAMPSANASLLVHASYKDEIGKLARIFDLSIRKSRAKDRQLYFRKTNEMRYAEEQVKSRHSILEAIGHEIRSPLQSLLNRTFQSAEIHTELERMRRAVDALYLATSVESGLKNGRIALERADVATYLTKYAKNLSEAGNDVIYLGASNSVFATFDPINFEQVLEHVFGNADRHKAKGSVAEIRLIDDKDSVVIEIFNLGKRIEVDKLETIFDYGISSADGISNLGLGLFVARIYMAGMQGAIRAENQLGGVAIVITLPRSKWSA
jgi:signal transduction histidine kinase